MQNLLFLIVYRILYKTLLTCILLTIFLLFIFIARQHTDADARY